jgi:hypothetical protein
MKESKSPRPRALMCPANSSHTTLAMPLMPIPDRCESNPTLANSVWISSDARRACGQRRFHPCRSELHVEPDRAQLPPDFLGNLSSESDQEQHSRLSEIGQRSTNQLPKHGRYLHLLIWLGQDFTTDWHIAFQPIRLSRRDN